MGRLAEGEDLWSVALQRRAADAPLASHELFLAVAFPHDEMRILDYNRVVADLSGLSPDALLAKVGASFGVEPSAAAVQPAEPETFGMFVADRWYRLRIRPELVPRADSVASLDVSLLQEHLLAPILGIGDPRTDKRIDFVVGVRGVMDLEQRVRDRRAAIAFALHPTRMEQLMARRRCGQADAAEVDVVRAEARRRAALARARLSASLRDHPGAHVPVAPAREAPPRLPRSSTRSWSIP
jgi:uncharacterized protein (DUF1015 family)